MRAKKINMHIVFLIIYCWQPTSITFYTLVVQNVRELYDAKNSRMDLLIPLVILALCFFLSLAVIIYIQYCREIS